MRSPSTRQLISVDLNDWLEYAEVPITNCHTSVMNLARLDHEDVKGAWLDPYRGFFDHLRDVYHFSSVVELHKLFAPLNSREELSIHKLINKLRTRPMDGSLLDNHDTPEPPPWQEEEDVNRTILELESIIQRHGAIARKMTEWRHKRVAHCDFINRPSHIGCPTLPELILLVQDAADIYHAIECGYNTFCCPFEDFSSWASVGSILNMLAQRTQH